MKPAARLIYGPANSGKTERCIAAYLDCLCARRNEKAMFLCPTALKVAEVKARIVASGRIAGIRDPRILEFYGLAQRVIASAAQKAREISPLVKTLIIQDVVSKQLKAGRLRYFQPISEFQGFFEMVGDFIGELKAAAVTPEEFAEAIGRRAGRRGSQRDAEISGIYTDYQERLRREDLYDREGRLWLARDLLRGKEESFVGEKMDLLLVDGFASFSPAELQIVSELAKRSGETVITLTFVKNEGSGRHYRAVERTHALLHGSFDLMEEPTASAVKSFPLPFQEVADNLFADLIPSSSVQAHPHVEMIAAPGQLREIEEVAREIKKLLIPPQTLPWLGRVIVPDDILVILRSLAEYGDRVEEVFQQFGIPVLVHRTRRLCESPLVKTLLSALEAVAGDGERDAVLGFLKSSYVRTSALKDGAEPDQIATAALRAGVIAGLNEWPERIRRYRNRLEAQSSSGSLPEGENQPEGIAEKEDLQRLEQAARTVSAILADLRTIPAHGTPAQFLKAIASLVERFAMEDAIWLGAPEEAKRDVAALGQLRRELADALRLLGDRKTPLQEFCKLFREICQSPLSFSPEAREGKVQVMDAHESRQLHFPIVFVAGLAEKEFPRYQSEDALYDDESRRQLKNQGISLPPRALRAADEMLLFYSAVTRATQKLYLAYPLTDNEGKEKLRSYFVDELLSLFKGKISERRASVCEAAPSLEAVFRPRDLFGSMAYSLYQ
jgi:ATP-dependent helicase/nuclease subunit B